jgi:hypothetical protein
MRRNKTVKTSHNAFESTSDSIHFFNYITRYGGNLMVEKDFIRFPRVYPFITKEAND